MIFISIPPNNNIIPQIKIKFEKTIDFVNKMLYNEYNNFDILIYQLSKN